MRKHNSDEVESMEVFLSKSKTPIAYNKKVNELVRCGMTKEEAENFVDTTPFEMEFYYQDDLGLFMVEAEAVEGCTIINPYTGKELEENAE